MAEDRPEVATKAPWTTEHPHIGGSGGVRRPRSLAEAIGALSPPPPGTVVRVAWPGEPHPDGRLARIVRYRRGGGPVVQLYYFGRGAPRPCDDVVTTADSEDQVLADAIDQVLGVEATDGAAGPRSR